MATKAAQSGSFGKSITRKGTSSIVRICKASEYKEAASTLAEAFADDHVARYFVDTPDQAHLPEQEKSKLFTDIIEYITYANILDGMVTTAGENYGCVALWLRPGDTPGSWLTLLRSGLWQLYFKLSPEGKKRFFHEFFPLLDATKESVLQARNLDSYYLVWIGTRPSATGRGLARQCIEHVTEMADREGRACYLESSNDINPKIYRKFGFEEVRKIALIRAEHEIALDIMVREPVKAGVPMEKKPAMPVSVIAMSVNGHTQKHLLPKMTAKMTAKVTAKMTASQPLVPNLEKSVVGTTGVKAYAIVKTDLPSAMRV